MVEVSDVDKVKAARQCNFLFLFMISTAAWILTMYSTSYCAYMSRDITLVDGANVTEVCDDRFPLWNEQDCKNLLNNHGVGFWGWQITIPENQLWCFPYTIQVSPGRWITPYFDTKFNSARAFTIVASFFGALAFFTLGFASCCPLPPERMKCLAIYFLIAGFFQGMALIFQRSNVCQKGFFDAYFQDDPSASDVIQSVSCSLSQGSNMAVAACVLYFWAMCICPKADPPSPQGMMIQQQQEEEGQSGGGDDTGGNDAA